MQNINRGVLALAMSLAACATTEDTGRVEVPLSSTTSDGTVYSMPSGTYLFIGGPRFEDTVLADSLQPLSVQLPVGAYEIALVHDFFPSENWMLTRRNPDGSVESVPATLETPMPIAFQLLPDETVSVTIRFHVPGHGPITFAQGQLDVTAEVDEVEATSALVSFGVQADATSTFFDGPPELATKLPSGPMFIATTMQVTGVWEQRSLEKACASVASLGANAPGGYLDAVGLAVIGDGELCIHNNSGTHLVTYTATYVGPAAELGTNDGIVQLHLIATLPEAIFHDGTLELQLLEGTHEGLSFQGSLTIEDRSSASLWYLGTLVGTVDFSFIPRE